jgi:hypothetical protein
MATIQYDGHSMRFQNLVKGLCNLVGETFLNLEAAGVNVDKSGDF